MLAVDGSGSPATSETHAIPAGIISVEGFSGPIDVLLDRLRAKSLDIMTLSIPDLVDLVCREVSRSDVAIPVSAKASWVVAAATIALLKSRLLLPACDPDRASAEAEARDLQQQLLTRDEINRATSDLIERWSAGPVTYARGDLVLRASLADASHRPVGKQRRRGYSSIAGGRAREIFDLLNACISAGPPRPLPIQYRPKWLNLCRSSQAQHWMMSRMGEIEAETSLDDLTRKMLSSDSTSGSRRKTELEARAYVASMFMASLELARGGMVTLTQEKEGPVRLTPSPAGDQNDQLARMS
jgi:segregation and condensation protein A